MTPPVFYPILGVFPLDPIADIGVNLSTYIKLFSREIILEVQGKNWRGGCGGWTLPVNEVTPTVISTHKKPRGSAFNPPQWEPCAACLLANSLI